MALSRVIEHDLCTVFCPRISLVVMARPKTYGNTEKYVRYAVDTVDFPVDEGEALSLLVQGGRL